MTNYAPVRLFSNGWDYLRRGDGQQFKWRELGAVKILELGGMEETSTGSQIFYLNTFGGGILSDCLC